MLINGELVVEVDYSACQLRLTYASVGQPDPLAGEVDQRDVKIDLYAGIGMDRDVAKRALLIMINARHQQSAELALAKWFRDNDRFLNDDKPLELAKRATRVVASHFAVLKSAFFSDLGLKLQRLDADICAEVQREFRARGIAVLSVHDSFIVARRHEEELRAVMSAAFKRGMLSVRDMLVHSPA